MPFYLLGLFFFQNVKGKKGQNITIWSVIIGQCCEMCKSKRDVPLGKQQNILKYQNLL